MSEETKRDVFDKLLNEYVDDERRIDGIVYEPDQHIAELDREYFINSYDAALPDEIAVIPEAVGKYLKRQKHGKATLRRAMLEAIEYLENVEEEEGDWIFFHSDVFAHAWLDGVWRVEETGEIVKLEAGK